MMTTTMEDYETGTTRTTTTTTTETTTLTSPVQTMDVESDDDDDDVSLQSQHQQQNILTTEDEAVAAAAAVVTPPPPAAATRATQLLSIIVQDFVWPVANALVFTVLSTTTTTKPLLTWDDFWELPIRSSMDFDSDADDDATSTTTTSSTSTTTSTTTIAQQFTTLLERLGVTYVKFGQALSARPDIVPRSLAMALQKLQDRMDVLEDEQLSNRTAVQAVLRKEWQQQQQQQQSQQQQHANDANDNNNNSIPSQLQQNTLLDTLSEHPVAAASIGVVYSAFLPNNDGTKQKVCIKLQRPSIKHVVQQDAQVLRTAAKLLESIPALPTSGFSKFNVNYNKKKNSKQLLGRRHRFIQTDLSAAVDEFMSRIVEELDYRNEVRNIDTFRRLYSSQSQSQSQSSRGIQVVAPKVYHEWCTERVIVMEWIEGIKLIDLQRQQRQRQKVDDANNNHDDKAKYEDAVTKDLIQQGIDCTLSQLLDTGILHADPHGGNLMKVAVRNTDTIIDDNNNSMSSLSSSSSYRLGYVDFGLLSTVPSNVQDGLICAVAQLIFGNNISAVADLFGELQLLPAYVLDDPMEREALSMELEAALSQVLVYEHDTSTSTSTISPSSSSYATIPTLRFDKLLDVLSRLVPRFQFQLPPYFLNNARALSTLEGMAREIDPTFNVLQSVYPYTLRRLLGNPSNSPVVEATLNSLVEDTANGRLQVSKLRRLVQDASWYSGYSQRKVVRDVLKTKNGRKLMRRLIREQSSSVFWIGRSLLRKSNVFQKATDYLRL